MKLTRQVAILALVAGLSAGITYLITHKGESTVLHSEKVAAPVVVASQSGCDFEVMRQDGFKYIQPVQSVQVECESRAYQPMKAAVMAVIDSNIRAGILNRASVYFRAFENSEWFAINPEEVYHPGSLMKVANLITYLKMAEEDPGLLDRQIVNNVPEGAVPNQLYTSQEIVPGQTYTVRELLRYMIGYSDNTATMLLLKNIDKDAFLKMHTDLHLEVPDLMDINYTMSPVQFAEFLVTVYNGSYLTKEYSEFAAELLATCDFDEGFAAGLPESTPFAHKFGEWSDGQVAQLHDAGIVYLDGKAYAVVVMTDGANVQTLPEVISEIGSALYKAINNPKIPDTTFKGEYYSEFVED